MHSGAGRRSEVVMGEVGRGAGGEGVGREGGLGRLMGGGASVGYVDLFLAGDINVGGAR